MSIFSATVTVSGSTYPSSPDASVPFEPKVLSIKNTDGLIPVFVRIGASGGDSFEVAPGKERQLGGEGGWQSPGSHGFGGVFSGVGVFVRAASGTPVVRITAES